MEDNFYKVSSEKLFSKPKQATEKYLKEKRAYEKEAPIISATIARLEKQIAHFKSIDAVKTETDPEQCMREIAINKRVVAILERELKWLEGRVKTYEKK